MIKITKRNTYIVLTLLLCNTFIQSIPSSTAHIGTLLAATFCAGSSYKIIYSASEHIHPVILTSISSLITMITYYLLNEATPICRIKKANNILNNLARHTLARTSFNDEHTFFDTIQDAYLTNELPLISAYNHLINLIPKARYALGLINKASADVTKDIYLQEKCNASLARANILLKNIAYAIKRIKKHKDYLPQLRIYRESLLQNQQTIAQQQIETSYQQITDMKQKSALLKWLKFFSKSTQMKNL